MCYVGVSEVVASALELMAMGGGERCGRCQTRDALAQHALHVILIVPPCRRVFLLIVHQSFSLAPPPSPSTITGVLYATFRTIRTCEEALGCQRVLPLQGASQSL